MSVCVFVLIHLQEHFQIDAFSMKTLSVLVWTESLNASTCMRFQNENALFWTGSYSFLCINAVFFFSLCWWPMNLHWTSCSQRSQSPRPVSPLLVHPEGEYVCILCCFYSCKRLSLVFVRYMLEIPKVVASIILIFDGED